MSPIEIIIHILVYLSCILVIGPLGNMFCRKIFKWSKITKISGIEAAQAQQDIVEDPRAGRLIGHFERILIFIGIILRSWEILVAVVALKTVARYKELDTQINAEYFLIGSMASILVAVLMALALMGYDHYLGFDLFFSISKDFSSER